MSGKHAWNEDCSHGNFSAYAYGPLSRLHKCVDCGQLSVVLYSWERLTGQVTA